jgi:hypothetical protein
MARLELANVEALLFEEIGKRAVVLLAAPPLPLHMTAGGPAS